jgi:hypothetical protein
LAVQWLNEALCAVASLALADNLCFEIAKILPSENLVRHTVAVPCKMKITPSDLDETTKLAKLVAEIDNINGAYVNSTSEDILR